MSDFIVGFKLNTLLNQNCDNFEKVSYYLGKTVRLAIAVPLALTDIAIQALQIVNQTFEMLDIKAES